MADRFGKLAERQILKALAEGKLQGLDGEGRPLPDHPEAAMLDAAEAAGFRIMAEAGALPEELRLRRVVEAAKARYRAASTDPARRVAMAEIARAEMDLAIATEARRRFMKG